MSTGLTFIAPAYNEKRYNRHLIDSLMMQTDSRWNCIIYHNGTNNKMREWVDSYSDNRLMYKESPTNTGHGGCYNRIDALRYVTTSHVVQTSIQDYYLKWAVELILNRLQGTNADMCFWDSINHLSGYEVLNTKLELSYIDWGNFCWPVETARVIGIPKIEESVVNDWEAIQKGLADGKLENLTKIANVLTIHN